MKKTEKMIHQNIRFRSRIDTFLVSIEEFPSPSYHNPRHPSHSQSSPLCDKSDCAAGDVSVHSVAAAVARLHLARFPGTINFSTFVIISNIYIYLQCYLLVVRTPRHALVLLPRRWRRGRGLRLLQLGGGRAGLHRPVL